MAHFAEINSEGVVGRVLVLSNDVITRDGEEVESVGVEYLQRMFPNTNWVQTSYNNNFRKRYAGMGYTYDSARDAFLPPQPYPSWTLSEETLDWVCPKPMPEQEAELGEEGFIHYAWNESAGEWQEVPERPEGHWWSEEDWAWYPPMPNDGQHYVWNNESKEWDVDNSAPNAGG